MLKILSNAGSKVQGICSQAMSKIQATFSSSIEKIKGCVKTVFAACANVQARILGLGQSGHKAIVLVAGKPAAKEEVAVQTEEVTVKMAEESKQAPVLTKMERVKQAVKDGSATVAKAMQDHPRITAVVIAAGMFGIGKVLQAKFSTPKLDQGNLPDWASRVEEHSAEYELEIGELFSNSSASELLAFDKNPDFLADPAFKANQSARQNAHAAEVRKFLDSIQEQPTEWAPAEPKADVPFAFEGPGERVRDPASEKAIADQYEAEQAQSTIAAFGTEDARKTIADAAGFANGKPWDFSERATFEPVARSISELNTADTSKVVEPVVLAPPAVDVAPITPKVSE